MRRLLPGHPAAVFAPMNEAARIGVTQKASACFADARFLKWQPKNTIGKWGPRKAGRRGCAVTSVLRSKTSAEAEFISAEH